MYFSPVGSAAVPSDIIESDSSHRISSSTNQGDKEDVVLLRGTNSGLQDLEGKAVDSESRVCRHWDRGFCQRGEKCGFDHPGDKEQSLSAFSRAVCRHWRRGFCQLSDSCSFRHPEEALRKDKKAQRRRSMLAPRHDSVTEAQRPSILSQYFSGSDLGDSYLNSRCTLCTLDSDVQTAAYDWQEAPSLEINAPSAKGLPCRFWEEGFCRKGDSCQFSHQGRKAGLTLRTDWRECVSDRLLPPQSGRRLSSAHSARSFNTLGGGYED